MVASHTSHTEQIFPVAPKILRRHLLVGSSSLLGLFINLGLCTIFSRPLELSILWITLAILCGALCLTAIFLWRQNRKHRIVATNVGLRVERPDETIQLAWSEIDAVYHELRQNSLLLHRPVGDIAIPLDKVASSNELQALIRQRVTADAYSEEAQATAWPLIAEFRKLLNQNDFALSARLSPEPGWLLTIISSLALGGIGLVAWSNGSWLGTGGAILVILILLYIFNSQPQRLRLDKVGVHLAFRRRQSSIAWADIQAVYDQHRKVALHGREHTLLIPKQNRWRGETTRQTMNLYLGAQLWVRQIPVRERWFWPAWSSRDKA